jgi:hypothetical protein
MSKEAAASQCQTCPAHVAIVGKGQKTCQTPNMCSLCWPQLAMPGQGIQAIGARHLSD